ncbi:hypothetical protein V2I01_33130 [Micromonospora sp. BRA006-A]|nr:hypothetical protein [Micromonospora sp. BRA006-A]
MTEHRLLPYRDELMPARIADSSLTPAGDPGRPPGSGSGWPSWASGPSPGRGASRWRR